MIAENGIDNCQSAASAKENHEYNKVIDDDALGVGFARLAVVLRVATLAFDMAHHFWTNRAAPPGVVDWFGVGLSALGAGRVLGWGLHEIPPMKM